MSKRKFYFPDTEASQKLYEEALRSDSKDSSVGSEHYLDKVGVTVARLRDESNKSIT